MSTPPAVTNGSLWEGTAPSRDPRPALEQDVRVEVAVVGAGIVGLTTALAIADRDLDVAVFEARHIGAGTSGSTTGKFSVQNGLRYHRLRRHHGAEGARAYASAALAGIERTTAIVADHGIECGFERPPSHLAVTTDDAVGMLESEAAAASDAGLRTKWGWGDTALPVRARAVLTFEDEVQLHPAAYLGGLADALVAAGVAVHEGSRVVDLRRAADGSAWELEVGGCRVLADHVVVATRLPAVADHRLTFARAAPVGASVIAATTREPLPTATALIVGESTWSVRASRWPAAAERLVVAGPDVVWEDGPRTSDAVERWASSHWPDLDITHRWFAQDQQAADDRPLIGRLRDATVWTATGFSKWGLALGTYAAELIATGIAGQPPPPHARFFDAGRTHVRHGIGPLVADNATVAARWLAGRLRRPSTDEPLEPGEGRVRRRRGTLVAEARDRDGSLHRLNARCTHLGCPVSWNRVETTWDCRCHGARFAVDGRVLEAPATEPLTPIEPTESAEETDV